MVSFGKRINFRPLVISLIYFFVFSFLFMGILAAVSTSLVNWGWIAGLIMFLLVIGIYYPNVVGREFNFFEINHGKIEYYDFGNRWHRVQMILLGGKSSLQVIDVDSVADAHIFGKESLEKIPSAVPYPVFLSVFSGILTTVKNPSGLELDLKNGKKIFLSAARDKAYDPEQTAEKLKDAQDLIKANIN